MHISCAYTWVNSRISIKHNPLYLCLSHCHRQKFTFIGTIHNRKQTVISRSQAASQFFSTLLLVYPRLWGGATTVGFNKSIVFGSCLKGLGFILECCCCCFCCCGCGRREGYCAGTWGRLGSVSMQGPPRTGAYCLIVSIYNVWVRVCAFVYVCVRE